MKLFLSLMKIYYLNASIEVLSYFLNILLLKLVASNGKKLYIYILIDMYVLDILLSDKFKRGHNDFTFQFS